MTVLSTPLLVRQLLTVGVATCTPDTPIAEIARLFLQEGLEEIVVLDEGHAVGVVSQAELVLAHTRQDSQSLTAEGIMREKIHQVPADIPVMAAAQIMLDQGVRALYLTHHASGIEYPAAVISYHHIMRHMAARDENDLRDLGIQAERQSPLEVFIQRRDAARQQRKSRS